MIFGEPLASDSPAFRTLSVAKNTHLNQRENCGLEGTRCVPEAPEQ